jgi:hypothetical protein
MYKVTTYDIVSEVAALTGKVVRVAYGDNYSVGLRKDDELVLTIPRGTSYMSPTVRAGILHETLHIIHTDDLSTGVDPTKRLKEMGYKPEELRPLFQFINAFEDIRIQLKGEEDLPGARFIFQTAHDDEQDTIFKDIWGNVEKTEPFAKMRAYYCSAIAMLPGYTTVEEAYDGYDFDDDNPSDTNKFKFMSLCGRDSGFLEVLETEPIPKSKSAYLTELDKKCEGFCDLLRETKTTQEGFELSAKYFLKGFIRLLPPDLKKMYEDQKKMEQMMKDLVKALQQATKDLMESIEKGEDEAGGSVGGSGLMGAAAKDDKSRKDLMDKVSKAAADGTPLGLRPDQESFAPRINVIQDKCNQLNAHLAPILERVKEWQERGCDRDHLKRGKLDGKHLYKVAVDEVDIFHREVDPEVTDDVAFSVVVDLSGSMGGDPNGDDPMNVAFGLGAGLNTALTKIGKPCTLVTFSDNGKVVLDAGQQCTSERLADGLADSGGGTNLRDGIRASLDTLDKRPEKMKVQFILSDGDVSPDYLGASVRTCSEHGVIPYFIYITNATEHHTEKFTELTRQAMGDGHKLKFAVVKKSEASSLLPQLTKFVEGLLEGKQIN